MKKGLNQKQFTFSLLLAILIIYIYIRGYTVQIGDVFARDGHKKNSFHYKHLAVDLNLFKDGVYLTTKEAHAPFGAFWKLLGGTWGGDFKSKDANHYSYGE